MAEFYRLQQVVAALLYPQRKCINCGALSIGGALCGECSQLWQKQKSCTTCASFARDAADADTECTACRTAERSFVLARAALPYEKKLRNNLLAFKYQARTGLRRPLADLLLQTAERHYAGLCFDAVVPVPLAPRRMQSRGYNQSELLSKIVAAELNLCNAPHLLRRVRDTRLLADLTRSERMQELKGAFAAEALAAGQRVLLVDDIFTTGATAHAASRALLQAGAESVHVLCVAGSRVL